MKFISHFMRNTAELKLNENVISYMRKLPHANYKTIGELKREVDLLEIPGRRDKHLRRLTLLSVCLLK